MLQESKTNELEYQRLSKEEMESRGILGRLVGICADFISPTRNGRKYPEQLWENVFEDPIMQERINNGVCYGELGHPADREETDMEKIAVCMAEQPKKGSDGKLRAVFDILDTPNGRILKSLCDYGSTLGISSRGSGDLETDFDGQESVNPDTYNCEGFDVVLIPAIKEARLQYVTEALDKKRYNKTLREKLTESISKETEEHQKIINESLSTLGMSLNEDAYTEQELLDKFGTTDLDIINVGNEETVTLKQDEAEEKPEELTEEIYLSKDWRTLNVGDDVQWTSKEFDGDTTWDCTVKDVYDDHIIICPKDEKFSDSCMWIDDDFITEQYSLNESKIICEARKLSYSQQEAKMDAWHNGTRGFNVSAAAPDKLLMNHRICWDKGYGREVGKIESEMLSRHIPIPSYSDTATAEHQRRLMGTYDNPPDVDEPQGNAKPEQEEKLKPTGGIKNGIIYVKKDEAGEMFMLDYPEFPIVEVNGTKYYEIKPEYDGAVDVARGLSKALNESLFKLQTRLMSESVENGVEDIESVWDEFDEVGYDALNNIESNVADDDGALVEELQKSLELNKELDRKTIDLQEKLSVSYAKEVSLQEELEAQKAKVIKLSRRLAEEKRSNERLNVLHEQKVIADKNYKKLQESTKSKDAKITSLRESIAKQDEQIKQLQEQLGTLTENLAERENEVSNITEKYETLNKNYQQSKDHYAKKVEQQNTLVEKYRSIAAKSVNKYIDTQATRLGVQPSEIKNRLPESYSFTDIDKICEDLQEYNLNISSLPFSANQRLNENVSIRANNVSKRTLVPVEDDVDELTLRLAKL